MENLHVLVCHLDLPCHPERMRGTSKAQQGAKNPYLWEQIQTQSF